VLPSAAPMDEPHKPEEFLKRFARIGEHCEVFGNALILNPEVIELGDWVRIDDYCRLEGGAGIRMGTAVHVESFSSIFGGGTVEIGNYLGIGQGARVITGSGHPWEAVLEPEFPEDDLWVRRKLRVVIEDYAWIGANAVVLPNVRVSTGGVVSAGAVVTKDVPPWTVVAGTPAKLVREREPFEILPEHWKPDARPTSLL